MVRLLILTLVLGGSLFAYDNDSSNDGDTYESSSGNKYKYDLSDPSDRNSYSTDVGAQIDDSVDPSVSIDRSMGEYGGGIIDD